jgi:hypothetical protein
MQTILPELGPQGAIHLCEASPAPYGNFNKRDHVMVITVEDLEAK